jgi:hypothetical protein
VEVACLMKKDKWQWLWLLLATVMLVILLLLILKWFIGYSLPAGISDKGYNFLHFIFDVIMVILLIQRWWSNRKK